MLITKDLFTRISRFTSEKNLSTSSYNHGRGVAREYTLTYCLQINYDGNNLPQRYFIKDGGRTPSRYNMRGRDLSALKDETPTFKVMCQNIMRKYSAEVLRTYNYK
jgi:hypothetical protein